MGMAQVGHGHEGVSFEPVLDRRKLFKIVGGVGVVAAAAGVYGIVESMGGSKHVESNNDEPSVGEKPADVDSNTSSNSGEVEAPSRFNVSAAQAEKNLQSLVLPDLYVGRPWADPEQLVGLTPEELRDIAAIPITDETRTDEGFAKVIGQHLSLIANAGKTIEDARKARQLGYPVGETDAYAQPAGKNSKYYGNYIDEYYTSDMIDGLFTDKYTDPEFAGADAYLDNFFLRYAGDFDRSLADETRRGIGTTFVSAEYGGQGPESNFDRNLSINLKTWLPGIENSQEQRDIYTGRIIVNASEGSNGTYRMAIQYVELNQQ